MNFTASVMIASDPSPVVWTVSPLRLNFQSFSKKLLVENHVSKPNRPGFSGSVAGISLPWPLTPLRCHLPKCPVAYPHALRAWAMVISCGRSGLP